jgi:antitoxin YefM
VSTLKTRKNRLDHLKMGIGINDNHNAVIVTRQNGKAPVIISLEDFKSYEETAYLMASLKNAKRLNDAITEIEANIA